MKTGMIDRAALARRQAQRERRRVRRLRQLHEVIKLVKLAMVSGALGFILGMAIRG